ncbi:MAG: thioredoxin domain-containing protein [Myxococcales bacterium]|nr:thioredoxin domain-containing protein [Myxococcales bacterium]
MKSHLLKKFWIHALAASIGAAACGGGQDSQKTPAKPETGTQAGAVAVEAPTEPAQPAPTANTAAPGLANLPRKGAENPKVVIIESSEFQCPFCSKVTPTVKQIVETYPNDVAVYFFHNPLAFHPNAMPAAKASMAAHKQGKFWEMHDKMFENQRELTQENFDKWAGELGLDMNKFKADMNDPAIETEIKRQQSAMVALGARGTPGFFVNGEALKGAQPFDNFKAAIDKHIAAVDKLIAGGEGAATAWISDTKTTNPQGADFEKWVVKGETPPANAQPPAAEKRPSAPPADATVWKVEVAPEDPRKGGAEPLVTVVVFSEFQCPFCSRVLPTLEQLHKDYGDDLAVVFKSNPLPFHKDAPLASEAALAAGEQGKFWEMHDKLFANQQALQRDKLEAYAQELGLNMDQFKAALDSGKFKEQIKRDQELAASVNARGTPNSFINGRQLVGAKPIDDFKVVVDEELKKAKALVDGGTPRAGLYAEIIKNGKVFKPLDDKVNVWDMSDTPINGDPAAKATVTIFSDFECPYCSRIEPILAQVREQSGGKVNVAFKHFPLSFHQRAMPAAKASMAAMEQGKFWEMHDKLFANQKELTDENFIKWAGELGLDVEKFKAALANPKWEEKVKKDMAEGSASGVQGTPSLYINGRKFEPAGGMSPDAILAVINTEILK